MRVLRFESWAMKGRVSARAVKMKSTGGTVRQTDRQTDSATIYTACS